MDPHKRKQRIAFFGILTLGIFLRFFTLGAKSIWLDEAFTLWVANHPFADVWRWIASIDQHPPLFYLLLSGWIKLFGDSEVAMRSLPALLGALTLPLFYITARRLTSVTGALLAMLLLAVSPFHIHYAQETRMYTLLTLAGCGAIYFVLRIVEGEKGRRGERGKGGWIAGDVVGLAVFQALGMWTHNTFVVFFPLAIILGLGLSTIRIRSLHSGQVPYSALRKLIIVQCLALLLWSPWLVNFVRQSVKVDQEFWIRSPGPGEIFDVLRRLLLEHFTITPVAGFWVALSLPCALLGFWWLRGEKRVSSVLLLSFWLTPFLAELLLSLRRPLLHTPSLIWTSLPFYLLLAIGIIKLTQSWQGIRRWSVIGFLLGLLAINLVGLSNYYQFVHKEQWADVASYVSQQADPKDLILFNATWVQLPFEYYAKRDGLTSELRGLPVDLFDRGVTEPKMSSDDLPYLRQLIAKRKRVWLVYSHDWYTDPEQIVLGELRKQMKEQSNKQFQGVRVFAFSQ